MATTIKVLQEPRDAHGIVEGYCAALTSITPHLPLVWAWFGDTDTREIRPQVAAGRSAAWARGLRIDRNLLTRRGPAFRALDGEASEPFSVSTLSIWAPWRDAARTEGIRSVLCLPLSPSPGRAEGGVFVLYADSPDYFEGLTGFFESLAEMFGSILAQSAAQAALSRMAMTDALTGVGNRLRFDQLCANAAQFQHEAAPTAVVMVDLDHFKSVNDRYGHAAGDTVLVGAAQALTESVRHRDTVLRLGGEEFVVLLQGATAAQAVEIAETIRCRLEHYRHVLGSGQTLQVTASFGVAQVKAGGSLPEALQRADDALYAAKRSGRNRVCLEGEMPQATDAGSGSLEAPGGPVEPPVEKRAVSSS